MDVTMIRDGLRTNDVELRSFEHLQESECNYVKLKFYDRENVTRQHDYLLKVILRYLSDSLAEGAL